MLRERRGRIRATATAVLRGRRAAAPASLPSPCLLAPHPPHHRRHLQVSRVPRNGERAVRHEGAAAYGEERHERLKSPCVLQLLLHDRPHRRVAPWHQLLKQPRLQVCSRGRHATPRARREGTCNAAAGSRHRARPRRSCARCVVGGSALGGGRVVRGSAAAGARVLVRHAVVAARTQNPILAAVHTLIRAPIARTRRRLCAGSGRGRRRTTLHDAHPAVARRKAVAHAQQRHHVAHHAGLLLADHRLNGRVGVIHRKRRRAVDLEQPRVQVGVHEEVEPQQLKRAPRQRAQRRCLSAHVGQRSGDDGGAAGAHTAPQRIKALVA
mmetsp:Transcript_20669/g.61683  ORF Transcript_20669/g.61683 Transcript_20669/m.61683 type:complete len:325 (-) Transcript_20669:1139-2113(-)